MQFLLLSMSINSDENRSITICFKISSLFEMLGINEVVLSNCVNFVKLIAFGVFLWGGGVKFGNQGFKYIILTLC